MDFELSAEQQMLANSLSRWLQSNYTFEQRREYARQAHGFSHERWRELAELGLLGINVPPESKGLGGTPADTFIVMQLLGRALVLEPYVTTAVVGAGALVRAGSTAQKATHLPALVAGERRFALATLEPQARFDLNDVCTHARREGSGFVLDGSKAVVLNADSADLLIVSARTHGEATAEDGITLFLIEPGQSGLHMQTFPTLDGQRAAEIRLEGVRLGTDAVLGSLGEGHALLLWTVDRAIAALAAEAVGAMEALLELTLEHLRTRRQFGQPIGKFQVLQHRVADMATAIEQARALALQAVARVDEDNARERRKALSAAKIMTGRSGRFVAQQAVQLHGGMGMTDEYPVGHYVKRLTCIDLTWGNVEHHTELYGALL
jgi:alkylation response protein AidB-like acyl-CoA dehydrogenase